MKPAEWSLLMAQLAATTAQSPSTQAASQAAMQGADRHLAAQHERERERQAKKEKKSNFLGTAGKVVGTVAGSALPIPFGSHIGGTLGETFGRRAGGADASFKDSLMTAGQSQFNRLGQGMMLDYLRGGDMMSGGGGGGMFGGLFGGGQQSGGLNIGNLNTEQMLELRGQLGDQFGDESFQLLNMNPADLSMEQLQTRALLEDAIESMQPQPTFADRIKEQLQREMLMRTLFGG